jgi:exosortase
MSEPLPPSSSDPAPPAWNQLALHWAKANPLAAAMSAALALTLALFYAVVPLYKLHPTVLAWSWAAWNPETRYEHAKLVPFIILFLIWNALPRLRAAKVEPSNWGWLPLGLGIGFYLLSARTLQPRIALGALPFLCLGISLYLWGRQVSRVLLFPIACLFFLLPLPGIDQATNRLQLFVAQAAKVICGGLGIHLTAVGTTLRATDESFNFEIAGGCSGINSLMAITLMTAIFAHLTQNRLWKQLLLFAASAPVAVVGNVARIVIIMVVAKCFGQNVAGGWFHDISPYLVSFPFAFGALCLLHKLINWRLPGGNGLPPSPPSLSPADPFAPAASRPALSAKAHSYDY